MSDTEIDSSAYVELHTLGPGHYNTVNTLCFSPDGSHLASGADDLALIIWKVADGKLLYRILFEAAVSRALWHPTHPDTIIVACDDGRVFQLFEFTATGCEQVDVKIGVLGEVHSLAYAHETRFLAVGMGEQVHVTREHEQNKYDVSIQIPRPPNRDDVTKGDKRLCPVALHFTEGGGQLVIAYLAHGIICYDVETRTSLWHILPRSDAPNIGSAALSVDGRSIITHNIERGVDLYAAGGWKSRLIYSYRFDEPQRSKHCLQVSFVQRCSGVLCGTTTGNICIWYKTSGEVFQKLHHDGRTIQAVAVSERERLSYIATGSVDEGQSAQIKIWRAKMNGGRKQSGNKLEDTFFEILETVTSKRVQSRKVVRQGLVIAAAVIVWVAVVIALAWGYMQVPWSSVLQAVHALGVIWADAMLSMYLAITHSALYVRNQTASLLSWASDVLRKKAVAWLEDRNV